jgi:hypothetical protein
MITGPDFEGPMQEAVNAMVMHVDWRLVLGFTPADAGTMPETLVAREALARVVERHNAQVARENAEAARAA